jgi:hypothetical protein
LELNDEAKAAAGELGAAINQAIENSANVSLALERLRNLGFATQLNLKLEIGLQQMEESLDKLGEGIDLELTDDDLKTLRHMKIRLDSDEGY